ncbi:tyrosine-type recombinase/integrase [Parabacteroides sp.]|uniref:tyrosine-type recombinase/integrase n=1 Tax=Parabacteroides sp. TaxID=1869337 RepID=UPI002845586D|nr:tyrosine-type recombinase/integrase [Parabacteroides sp.]MDR3856943.1 tyrosine-type recombinase/integrase [Parabacteroides sp.]
MKVEIKERVLPTGNRSLYLEYYETGFRKKEYLGIFLAPENSAKARKHNKEALLKAQEIKAQRILCPPDLHSTDGKKQRNSTLKLTWLEWCDEYIRWSEDCGNSRKMLQHKGVVRKRIALYLENRGKKGILLKDVDREVVSGLFDFMRNEYRNPRQIKTDGGKLADYTLLLFEETVKAIFNKAVRSDLIASNPIHDLTKGERFHAPDKHREFLTPEELTRFLNVETATGNERQVQLAFGLSSMTGLRLGDMQHLRWSDIKDIDGTPTICISQRKTKRVVSIPLNDLAQSLLPPRDESNPDALVYHLVKKSDNISKYVRRIKDKAGIEKDFTYHSSRHTTATLAITAGADISAVKEMLGHGSVTSTEVYAKVSLDKKIQAVNLTDGVFG